MTLDEQKKAVIALFDEAAGWGVPALDARHLPRIAGALGIGMPEPVRVPPAQVIVPDPMHEGAAVLHAEPVRVPPIVELEVTAEGTRIPMPEEVMEIRETKYGRLPVCHLKPAKSGEMLNLQCAVFCRTHNVERCAFVLPEGARARSMAVANFDHKQGYFVSETHNVFGLRQARHYQNRRPLLKLKGERHV
jgi:hypothetical protein